MNKLPEELTRIINKYVDPKTDYYITNLKNKMKSINHNFIYKNIHCINIDELFFKKIIGIAKIIKIFYIPQKTPSQLVGHIKADLKKMIHKWYEFKEHIFLALLFLNIPFKYVIKDDSFLFKMRLHPNIKKILTICHYKQCSLEEWDFLKNKKLAELKNLIL
jgi:hypothetical protein